MIIATIGIFVGALIGLETWKNWRTGSATTAWAIYPRAEHPKAFARVIAAKVALSVLAIGMSFLLLYLGRPQ